MLLIASLSLTAALLWAAWVFNRLVRLRNQTRTAWADIDVQLTRRHDLVPQLVAAVRGYAGHEREMFALVAELRALAMSRPAPGVLGGVETALQDAIGHLFALQEAYPELKASDGFLQLQRDLVAVEEQLQYARRFYNGAVRDYNDGIQKVPDLLVARAFGFAPAEFFQAGDGQRDAPGVQIR